MKKQVYQQAGQGGSESPNAWDQGESGPAGVQNLQAVTQLLEIQRDLAIDLLPDRNLLECLDVLLASAMRLPGFDCGGIYLCDEESGELRLIAHHGLSDGFVEQVSHYPADSPQAMLVRSGALVYAMRSDLPPEVAGMIASEGLETLAVIPVRDDGRVIAALNVSSHGDSRIELASRVALESLVAQAEGAIVLIRARDARQHAERQLRLAVDGAELGTWVADFESGVFEASPRARALHGIEADGPLTIQFAMDSIHPEDQPKVTAALERTIRYGEPFSLEYRIAKADDGGRWILSEARSFDHNGRKRLYGIVRDVTPAKKAAARLQAQQTELDHAQRLALVSEVSAGIIHQIGQPLCAMGANVSVALNRLRACASPICGSMEIVRDIEADVARLREAVSHLRALAHPEQAARVRTDFNELVAGVLRLLRQEAESRRISLSAAFGEDLPPILADPVQLSQIILNVVRNAFDACSDCPQERRMVTATTRHIGGEGVELCVGDTGSGIAPEVMDRLFAPFFSTKPEGLGMGLRLSRTIVEAHGGTIEACNNPDGIGASFRVILPIMGESDETQILIPKYSTLGDDGSGLSEHRPA